MSHIDPYADRRRRPRADLPVLETVHTAEPAEADQSPPAAPSADAAELPDFPAPTGAGYGRSGGYGMRPVPRKSGNGWIVAVAVLVPLGCLAVGAAIWFLGSRGLRAGGGDRGVVTTIDDLRPLFTGVTFSKAHEKLNKTRLLDGSLEIEYEYDPPDEPYLVVCTATFDRSKSEARSTFGLSKAGNALGLRSADLTEVPRNDLFKWGDECRVCLVKSKGAVVGTTVPARKGSRVFDLLLIGLPLETTSEFNQVLGPTLRRLDAYKP